MTHGTHHPLVMSYATVGAPLSVTFGPLSSSSSSYSLFSIPREGERGKVVFSDSLLTLLILVIMEKCRSFPQYSSSSSSSSHPGGFSYSSSSSHSGRFDYEDRSNSYSFNGPKFTDPELKRKKRVASYNVFTVEGKLKSSVRNSFKWIKSKFTEVRYH